MPYFLKKTPVGMFVSCLVYVCRCNLDEIHIYIYFFKIHILLEQNGWNLDVQDVSMLNDCV